MLADNDIKSQIHNMQCQRQMFNLILSVKIRHFFFLSWILKNFKFSFKKFSINNIQKVHVKRPPDHRQNSTESPNALVTLRKSVLLKLFFFFEMLKLHQHNKKNRGCTEQLLLQSFQLPKLWFVTTQAMKSLGWQWLATAARVNQIII